MTDSPTRTTRTAPPPRDAQDESAARLTLAACFLGMFVVTLDAVVVNVALPSIRTDLGAGMTALQWIVDAYTLALAALLLTAGAVADRIGARRAFAIGMAGFVIASAACGLAPGAAALVVARVVQGAAASLLVPTSMALIGHAYSDPARRERAVGVWAMGGAVASSAGPVVGGLLTQVDWRLIFMINVPVGAVALLLVRKAPASERRTHPIDVPGLLLAVAAMGSLTWAAVETGPLGPTAAPVLAAWAVAVAAGAAFLAVEARAAHPMLPLRLFRSRSVSTVTVVGFAFMAAYYGTPFVMSLDLQGTRGLGAVATGVVFLPMMLVGLLLTPFSARLVEAFGRPRLVVAGLALIASGTAGLAILPATAPVWAVSALMVLVGLGGPTVMPPATAALLASVDRTESGVASAVLNTSRQLGGALAVAALGTFLAGPWGADAGLRWGLAGLTAVVAVTAVVAGLGLRR